VARARKPFTPVFSITCIAPARAALLPNPVFRFRSKPSLATPA
jgi:hypothetical protein